MTVIYGQGKEKKGDSPLGKGWRGCDLRFEWGKTYAFGKEDLHVLLCRGRSLYIMRNGIDQCWKKNHSWSHAVIRTGSVGMHFGGRTLESGKVRWNTLRPRIGDKTCLLSYLHLSIKVTMRTSLWILFESNVSLSLKACWSKIAFGILCCLNANEHKYI